VRATVKETELCFQIARAASLAGFQHVFPPDLYEFPDDAIRADWISALNDSQAETYIAFEDDEAVGVVSLGRGVLATLYVMPESWSQGVGSALHDRKSSSTRFLREARMAPHRADAGGAVPAPSDRCRVRPLHASPLAAQ
jgi:GNAT superfamily N-acetyltransferase